MERCLACEADSVGTTTTRVNAWMGAAPLQTLGDHTSHESITDFEDEDDDEDEYDLRWARSTFPAIPALPAFPSGLRNGRTRYDLISCGVTHSRENPAIAL